VVEAPHAREARFRTLFAHLPIDRELPALPDWPVKRILLGGPGCLTSGSSAPSPICVPMPRPNGTV
jgi:hypothetical protein